MTADANPAWSDLAERTEAVAMGRMMTDQPPEVADRLGVTAPPLADGVHTVVVHDPMWGYWNKALGFCEQLRGDAVDQAVERASLAGIPGFTFQLQPRAVPDDWDSITERHALRTGTMFVTCFGPAEPRTVETDLRIERLGPEHAAAFTDVMALGFGFEASPNAHAFFDGAHFFEGDWASYGAYDGDILVGVARMLAVAETGAVAIFGAATLPEGRNRGAQRALLDVRFREARDRGLRFAGRDLAGERGQPEPVAAQPAPGRPDRGAHAPQLGLARSGDVVTLRRPSTGAAPPARGRSAARSGSRPSAGWRPGS